jgi:hypothetical protein
MSGQLLPGEQDIKNLATISHHQKFSGRPLGTRSANVITKVQNVSEVPISGWNDRIREDMIFCFVIRGQNQHLPQNNSQIL